MATERKSHEDLSFRTLDSPVGPLTLAGHGTVSPTCGWSTRPTSRPADWTATTQAFPEAVEQLDAYFAGERTDFDLELDLEAPSSSGGSGKPC